MIALVKILFLLAEGKNKMHDCDMLVQEGFVPRLVTFGKIKQTSHSRTGFPEGLHIQGLAFLKGSRESNIHHSVLYGHHKHYKKNAGWGDILLLFFLFLVSLPDW